MQDNGPAFTFGGGGAWDQIFGGDGMYVAADPVHTRDLSSVAFFYVRKPFGDIFYFSFFKSDQRQRV